MEGIANGLLQDVGDHCFVFASALLGQVVFEDEDYARGVGDWEGEWVGRWVRREGALAGFEVLEWQ